MLISTGEVSSLDSLTYQVHIRPDMVMCSGELIGQCKKNSISMVLATVSLWESLTYLVTY